jgi:hypothetical protein
MPGHDENRAIFRWRAGLVEVPFLHREILHLRMGLEELNGVDVGVVLESLCDAAVDVFPPLEPLDLPAFRLRLARDDRLLQGDLVSLGQTRSRGRRGHPCGSAGKYRGDRARKQGCGETRHHELPGLLMVGEPAAATNIPAGVSGDFRHHCSEHNEPPFGCIATETPRVSCAASSSRSCAGSDGA